MPGAAGDSPGNTGPGDGVIDGVGDAVLHAPDVHVVASNSDSGLNSPVAPAAPRAGVITTMPSGTLATSDQPPWQQIHCSGDIPAGRIGHTMCTTKDETTIILYGGVNETEARASRYLDDLYNLDYATNTWRRIEMTGNKQQPRAFHSAVIHNDVMYIFGGCNGKGRFNKIFTIDRAGFCAVITPPTPSPATRYCHSAVLMEHAELGAQMYIFAGKCGGRNSNKRLSDVYRFRLQTNEWHECQQYGTIPPPRSAHAAFTFGRSMVIFGGRNANGECCEDLYDYCYDTCVWRQINVAQGQLVGRARHSVVLHNNTIVVFGGWNGRKKLNDMFFYNLENETFDLATELCTVGAPSRRECHVAVMCRNTMVVFAGRFRGEFMNDTFHMKLEPKSLKANCRDWLLAHGVQYADVGLPDHVFHYVQRWFTINTPRPPLTPEEISRMTVALPESVDIPHPAAGAPPPPPHHHHGHGHAPLFFPPHPPPSAS